MHYIFFLNICEKKVHLRTKCANIYIFFDHLRTFRDFCACTCARLLQKIHNSRHRPAKNPEWLQIVAETLSYLRCYRQHLGSPLDPLNIVDKKKVRRWCAGDFKKCAGKIQFLKKEIGRAHV